MAVAKSKVGRFGLFLANPMVAKIDKVEEKGAPPCSYKGIISKTFFLLFLTVVGVLVYFLTHEFMPTSAVINVDNFIFNYIEAIIAFSSIILAAIGTFIVFKFVRSAHFFGMFYSLAEGYFLAFLFNAAGTDFLFTCLIAFGITILLVASMLLLYKSHLIKVDKKFFSCLITLIFVGIILSILVTIMSFIPVTKEYVKFITDNIGVVTICGALGIIVASLFLLVDFEVIDHSVEDNLPKKYEWLGAFALSFSVIELYLKVLNFVIRMMYQNSN